MKDEHNNLPSKEDSKIYDKQEKAKNNNFISSDFLNKKRNISRKKTISKILELQNLIYFHFL